MSNYSPGGQSGPSVSIFNNHGAMSRFRAANGLRKSGPSSTHTYVRQQRVLRQLNNHVPATRFACQDMAERLGTTTLDRERVMAWVHRLTPEQLDICEDFLEDDQLDAAIKYIMPAKSARGNARQQKAKQQ